MVALLTQTLVPAGVARTVSVGAATHAAGLGQPRQRVSLQLSALAACAFSQKTSSCAPSCACPGACSPHVELLAHLHQHAGAFARLSVDPARLEGCPPLPMQRCSAAAP